MLTLTLAFVTAFTVTHLALRPTIRIALNKHLCDEPSDRRSHKVRTPSLGGVPIKYFSSNWNANDMLQ